MYEVNVFMMDNDDDELDQLLERVQLEEPDSDGGSSEDNSSLILSQVQLFAAVGSPTEEPRSRTSLALNEGNNKVRHPEGVLCQRPALSSTQAEGGPCQRPALSSTQPILQCIYQVKEEPGIGFFMITW